MSLTSKISPDENLHRKKSEIWVQPWLLSCLRIPSVFKVPSGAHRKLRCPEADGNLYFAKMCLVWLVQVVKLSPLCPKKCRAIFCFDWTLCFGGICVAIVVERVAIGNPELQMRKASHCGSKQQWRSHAMITLSLLVRATYMNGVVLHAHPVRGEFHIQCNANWEVAISVTFRSSEDCLWREIGDFNNFLIVEVICLKNTAIVASVVRRKQG